MIDVDVRCDGNHTDGWSCGVTLRQGGRDVSSHVVRVPAADLDRLAQGAVEPSGLVKASFDFLLERESARSILRSFDLLDIAHYFPEYEKTIRHLVRPT